MAYAYLVLVITVFFTTITPPVALGAAHAPEWPNKTINMVNGRINLCEGEQLIFEDDLRGARSQLPSLRTLRLTFTTTDNMGGSFNGYRGPYQKVFEAAPAPNEKFRVVFEPEPLQTNETFREYSILVQTSSSIHKSDTMYGNQPIKVRVGGPIKIVTLKPHISSLMKSVITDAILKADLEEVNRIWKQACIQFRYAENDITNNGEMDYLSDGSRQGTKSNLILFNKNADEFHNFANLFFVTKLFVASDTPHGVVMGLTPGLSYCVIGNQHISRERVRTIAHELGHLLLATNSHSDGKEAAWRLMYRGTDGQAAVLLEREVAIARHHKLIRIVQKDQ